MSDGKCRRLREDVEKKWCVTVTYEALEKVRPSQSDTSVRVNVRHTFLATTSSAGYMHVHV